MNMLLPTALAFAKHDIACVPVWPVAERHGRLVCACGKADCRSPGKHPIAQLAPPNGPKIAPNGVLSASADAGVLKHWFSDLVPQANLAVSTAILLVLDIDRRHGGIESLFKFQREHGELPATWSVVTGSGGQHFYFRRPKDLVLELPIIAENIIKRGGEPPFGPGVDIPTYVLTPPSRHICGRHYEWDGHPADVPLADPPQWIVDKLTKVEIERTARTGMTPEEWGKMVGGTITEYRDDAATRVAGKLLRAVSLDPEFAYGLLHAWNQTFCRPPLGDHTIRQIFNRIAEHEADRLERRG